jgi:alanyl-tRNA synthetase
MEEKTMIANVLVIKELAEMTKCFMCKRRFGGSLLLPVKNRKRGVFAPSINGEWLFHLEDTHGLPHDIVRDWVYNSVYDRDLMKSFI